MEALNNTKGEFFSQSHMSTHLRIGPIGIGQCVGGIINLETLILEVSLLSTVSSEISEFQAL